MWAVYVARNLVKTPICPQADQPETREEALAPAGGSLRRGNRLLTRAAPILVPKFSAVLGKNFMWAFYVTPTMRPAIVLQ